MAETFVPRGRVERGEIRPRRAPVTPRTTLLDPVGQEACFEPLSIELRLADLIQRGRRGVVCLVGAPGSGKSIAIEHLAATLNSDADVLLVDDNRIVSDPQSTGGAALVVCTVPELEHGDDANVLAVLSMAPWTRDDVI
jgi:hypothetical protein